MRSPPSAWERIRIAFTNSTPSNRARFLIDQVVLTYTEDAFVDIPEVHRGEWENTVAFSLPTIQGLSSQEINRVNYWVDGQLRAIGEDPVFDYYAGAFLDDLGEGPHWVVAQVKGLDNEALVQSGYVWFKARSRKELLVNGGFEDGPWPLIYSSPPPNVQVVENSLDSPVAFDGQKALLLGGRGVEHESQAGQSVKMPKQMKTLDFSVRIRVATTEGEPDPFPENDDTLRLELWDAVSFKKIEEYELAAFYHDFSRPGNHDYFARYWRREISLPPGKYAGKEVLVLLKVREFNDKWTAFYVDNVSLRYTEFGLTLGP